MSFSRRAAAEMTRRVERITRQVIGNSTGTTTDALTWAGTFPGEIFGEVAVAVLDGDERSADATAMTDCELLVLNRRDFLPVLGYCNPR